MILHLKPGETGYGAVERAIMKKYGEIPPESLIVQLRTKHMEDEEWWDRTELLVQNGYDSYHPDWEWEIDWWEGEQFIDLVAVAKIWEIDISGSFAMEGPDE